MKEEPIRINSGEDLFNIVNNPEAHFVLTDDINLEAGELSSGKQIRIFDGVLDGNGHTIRSQAVHANYSLWDGFIGRNEGTIKNLNIEYSIIRSEGNIGGICTKNYGLIKNCSVKGKLDGNGKVGGVVVINKGKIIQCEVDSEIKSRNSKKVGGITAQNESLVESCHSSGEIEGIKMVGGVAGKNGNKIEYCSSDATIKALEKPNTSIGGIVGKNYRRVQGSYYYGEYKHESISDMKDNGILVGKNSGEIIRCYYLEGDKTPLKLIGTEDLGETENVGVKSNIDEIEKAILVTKI